MDTPSRADAALLALLDRLRQPADPTAWNEFVALCTPLLTAWARRRTRQAADAEDLMQDVFLSAMSRIGTLRTAAAFPGWLAAIARHRAMDHFRASRNLAPLDDRTVRTWGTRSAGEEAFEVLELIRSLPEAYRETLILRLVEGMTGPEIAARTGLTPESVRVNLCRGMKMLRRLL